ncbi:unnamed protein product [Moneuplotes crassus]|uniref:non-specific serine/threonine protein kinase n=1 Tax=Euplotes crassus TaxID=5936 RepID=A0AAD1UMM1_EUPCR|nr:unnamed protein product [Moneuplotes crassus]
MGNCKCSPIESCELFDSDPTPKAICITDFEPDCVIGKGGFGKVKKVKHKLDDKLYAMKEMLKIRVCGKKSIASVLEERNILETLHHPLLINMKYAFQTRSHLYLIMDLLTGGDMRYHLINRVKFKEKETRFIVACMVLALEYIHSNGYIHRDIKPENLVFDAEGYVHITDFGISKKMRPNNKVDTSGTPGYMAPEIMCRQNYNYSVDYFAVGVIAFECMFQRRPFLGRTKREIRDYMCNTDVQIRQSKIPFGWSYESADFINLCIKRKKFERIGHRGIEEVKSHAWLKDFDWEGLRNKTLKPPFTPPMKDNYDTRNSTYMFKDDYSQKSLKEVKGMMDGKIKEIDDLQKYFTNYYYDYRERERDAFLMTPTLAKDLKGTGTKFMT